MYPFKLALKRLAPLACLFLLLSHALGLLLKPRRIVALPWNTLAAVKFKYPAGHVVEEVAVVRDGNHRAGILLQVLFQPVNRLGIEVVGRLVEQQHIGLLQQQAAQGHAAAFATRQCFYRLILGRTAQRVHSAVELVVKVPCVHSIEFVLQLGLAGEQCLHLVGIFKHFGVGETLVHAVILGNQVGDMLQPFLHDLLDGLFGVELGILLEVTHSITRREHHLALILLVDASNNLQQRRFTCAVQAYDAYLRTIEKRQVNVLQNLFLWRVNLVHAHHRKYNFLVVGHLRMSVSFISCNL